MKILAAIAVILGGGFLTFVSVIFGALLLSSANGPTRGNWIAHYVFTYVVSTAIVLICLYILFRLFR